MARARTEDQALDRKLRRRPRDEEPSHELNIVPFLDIVVNLILFLLVAQSAMQSLGMVDVTAPREGKAPSTSDGAPRLTVGIATAGFFIAARGGVLPGAGDVGPTIPRLADGGYDYPALTARLRAIKGVLPPAVSSLFIAADDSVPYEVVVATLDASRADARGALFPEVAFTELR